MASPSLEPKIQVVQRNSKELAQNYPSWFRKLEWLGLISFSIIFSILTFKIVILASSLWFLIIPGFFCGFIVADFVCGFVHWLADTWGSPDIPVLGAALIRPFREHHVDQFAMTRHDFVETNAATALVSLPVFIACFFIPLGKGHLFFSFVFFFLFSLTFFGFLTNQIHKWSHSKKVPKFVRVLQKKRFILHPTHHQIHHTSPFNKHYCITNGWLNNFLFAINFFPTCEKLITKYTGALPRKDDIGEAAATAIVTTNFTNGTNGKNKSNQVIRDNGTN